MENNFDTEKGFDLRRFLFGSISHKFIFWLLIVVICLGTIGYLTITSLAENQLKETIGESSYILAQKTIDEVNGDINLRLEQARTYAFDLSHEQYLIDNNRQFDAMENRDSYIRQKDNEWVFAGNTITPFMGDLINNPLSQEIRNEFKLSDFYIRNEGYEVFPEVFITNRYGVNVAQTGKTSDYYQADEEWWQKAKENGVYVEDFSYDESSGVYSLSFCVAMYDEQGNFLGVMKTVYNFQEVIDLINSFSERDRSVAQNEIREVAIHVAGEIDDYLLEHPDMTVADLQASEEFQAIAVQPVGKTGYTAVTDYNTLICRFHKNPQTVNLDLHTLADKLPGFWGIMAKTQGGVEADGFYDWQEPDGSITEKYMYIAIVDRKTADGVGLHVAATAYTNEFSNLNYHPDYKLLTSNEKIIYATGNYTVLKDYSYKLSNYFGSIGEDVLTPVVNLENSGEKLFVHAHVHEDAKVYSLGWLFVIEYRSEEILAPIVQLKKIFLIMISTIVIILFTVGLIVSRKFTEPIEDLHKANMRIQQGHFNTRVNIKTGDELEELGASFNKTAEVLEDTERERKRLDKAKTEFLSITSHELRSPMTPMRAQLQMLLREYFGKLNKQQKESAEIVLRNTERLDRIIQDFLEISRIEAARLKFEFKKISPATVALRIVQEMKAFMPEKKIKIETQFDKMPFIEADPDRLGQVLRNLINNAIKFTPENGKIVVSGKMSEGMILFSVQDTGVGIKPEDQERLFEPFFQADNMYQHKSGGTGLGLAISKGIVESQNGKIWIESSPGKGSKFSFTVPLTPVKNIKPIKLLFSEKVEKDAHLKKVFVDFLGPLGDKEFDMLKRSKGISEKTLLNYLSHLSEKKILYEDKIADFKNEIMLVYEGKKRISEKDISEFLITNKNQRGVK